MHSVAWLAHYYFWVSYDFLTLWYPSWSPLPCSDVIVQIVDSRDPLMFRCEDLEAYVKEVDKSKVNVILINKSDFLTEMQR